MNAVEAIGEGPGRISVTTRSYELSERTNIALYSEQDISPGQYVEVTVADTGGGMTAEIAAKAFVDPFFTTKFLGRGLGLAEVQGVLRGLPRRGDCRDFALHRIEVHPVVSRAGNIPGGRHSIPAMRRRPGALKP